MAAVPRGVAKGNLENNNNSKQKARASETHTHTHRERERERERETAEGTVRGMGMVMVMGMGRRGGGHVMKEKTVARVRALTIFPYSGWLPSPIEPPMV